MPAQAQLMQKPASEIAIPDALLDWNNWNLTAIDERKATVGIRNSGATPAP
jgi:hypothetical protein